MNNKKLDRANWLKLEMNEVGEMINSFGFCQRIDVSNSPARCVGEKHKHFLPKQECIDRIIRGLNLYYTDLKIEFDNL